MFTRNSTVGECTPLTTYVGVGPCGIDETLKNYQLEAVAEPSSALLS